MTPKISYLHLGRVHDEFADVQQQFARQGGDLLLAHLDESVTMDWSDVQVVSPRMCRGLHLAPNFADRLERLKGTLASRGVVLLNRSLDFAAAINKRVYLNDLAHDGIPTISTRWVDPGEQITLLEVLSETGWQDAVIKPAVSTLAYQTARVRRVGGKFTLDAPGSPESVTCRMVSATKSSCPHDEEACEGVFDLIRQAGPVSVQPFEPAILTSGEFSYVFLAGQFTHAVQKRISRPSSSWIAHEAFGAENIRHAASIAEIRWAREVYDALSQRFGKLDYARVDAIQNRSRQLQLLECELVAPRLFLSIGDALEAYSSMLCAAALQ